MKRIGGSAMGRVSVRHTIVLVLDLPFSDEGKVSANGRNGVQPSLATDTDNPPCLLLIDRVTRFMMGTVSTVPPADLKPKNLPFLETGRFCGAS